VIAFSISAFSKQGFRVGKRQKAKTQRQKKKVVSGLQGFRVPKFHG